MTRPLAAAGTDTLDDKVRTRLAEIRAAAGVPHAQVSLDVLYYLPAGFLSTYAEMFQRAVKSDAGGAATAERQQAAGELGKAKVTGAGGAKTTGKRYKKTFVVLDERALELKTAVDKRLRNIGRDLRAALDGADFVAGDQPRCSGCGNIMMPGWNFCPKDGAKKV